MSNLSMQKPSNILKFTSVVILSALLIPSFVFAQVAAPAQTTASGLVTIIQTVARWIFTFLILVAVIFGLIAAYQYITAGGDAEKLALARTNTIYALVAMAIGILAFSIPAIVSQIVGLGTFTF